MVKVHGTGLLCFPPPASVWAMYFIMLPNEVGAQETSSLIAPLSVCQIGAWHAHVGRNFFVTRNCDTDDLPITVCPYTVQHSVLKFHYSPTMCLSFVFQRLCRFSKHIPPWMLGRKHACILIFPNFIVHRVQIIFFLRISTAKYLKHFHCII